MCQIYFGPCYAVGSCRYFSSRRLLSSVATHSIPVQPLGWKKCWSLIGRWVGPGKGVFQIAAVMQMIENDLLINLWWYHGKLLIVDICSSLATRCSACQNSSVTLKGWKDVFVDSWDLPFHFHVQCVHESRFLGTSPSHDRFVTTNSKGLVTSLVSQCINGYLLRRCSGHSKVGSIGTTMGAFPSPVFDISG